MDSDNERLSVEGINANIEIGKKYDTGLLLKSGLKKEDLKI